MLLDLQQKLSGQGSGYTDLYAPWGTDEDSGEVVVDKLLSYMLTVDGPWTNEGLSHLFILLSFILSSIYFVPSVLFLVLSPEGPYMEVFLRLQGEVLPLFWLF
jgi:hypothetical protein